MSRALPSHMYRDPMECAMRSEAQRCDGCRHLERMFDRELCLAGRKELKKCRKFELNRGDK